MEILISGTSMSVEDKHRADAAPAGELPKLTDQRREVARKFGMSLIGVYLIALWVERGFETGM